MHITILDGNPGNNNTEFDQYMDQLRQAIQNIDNQVKHLHLRDLNIQYCIGCFGCWVKKPGQCLIEDDASIVRRAVINSDVTIFASPIIMGTVSSELKRTLDRLLPLIHPYLDIVQGEVHHKRRYPKYPKLGLILGAYGDSDHEDIEITERFFHRLAINFMSMLYFTKQAGSPIAEVIDEINRL